MDRPAPSRSLTGPILILIGGAVTIVGSLLNWASLSVSAPRLGGLSQKISGTSATEGKVAIIVGIAMVIGGLLVWLAPNRGLRRGVAIGAIAGGLVIAGLTIYDISTKDTQFNDAFRKGVRSIPVASNLTDAQIDALRDRLGVTFSLEFGIILTLIGGAIGLVGGIVAMAAKEPEVAPSAFGGVGMAPPAAPTAPPPPAAPGPAPAPPVAPPPPAEPDS
jgi:hypothetical protein